MGVGFGDSSALAAALSTLGLGAVYSYDTIINGYRFLHFWRVHARLFAHLAPLFSSPLRHDHKHLKAFLLQPTDTRM